MNDCRYSLDARSISSGRSLASSCMSSVSVCCAFLTISSRFSSRRALNFFSWALFMSRFPITCAAEIAAGGTGAPSDDATERWECKLRDTRPRTGRGRGSIVARPPPEAVHAPRRGPSPCEGRAAKRGTSGRARRPRRRSDAPARKRRDTLGAMIPAVNHRKGSGAGGRARELVPYFSPGGRPDAGGLVVGHGADGRRSPVDAGGGPARARTLAPRRRPASAAKAGETRQERAKAGGTLPV